MSETSARATASGQRHTVLRAGLAAYVVGYTLHTIQHLVTLMAVTPPWTIAAGSSAWVLTVVAVVAVRRGHRLAAPGLAVLGLLTAIGLAAVHLPPEWSVFSQPWRHHNATTTMWLSLVAAVLGAIAATVAGVLAARPDSGNR